MLAQTWGFRSNPHSIRLIQSQYPTGGLVPPFPLEEEMDESTQPTQTTPRGRVRKERSVWVLQFAPRPVAGQTSFVFDDEPEKEETKNLSVNSNSLSPADHGAGE